MEIYLTKSARARVEVLEELLSEKDCTLLERRAREELCMIDDEIGQRKSDARLKMKTRLDIAADQKPSRKALQHEIQNFPYEQFFFRADLYVRNEKGGYFEQKN